MKLLELLGIKVEVWIAGRWVCGIVVRYRFLLGRARSVEDN